MSTSWCQRKTYIRELLEVDGDDEDEGIALDRLLHGQDAIGKTQKSSNVESTRFSDKDLSCLGPLATGQFGTVELVNCRLDSRVYVRKTVTKKSALRHREQFSPQMERHILLLALKDRTACVPHMLCAYQSSTHLNIVMEYAEGGSLWDVIESSPNDGRISPIDLKWWIPQCVSAIHWCHTQGFAHRDVKPHNFVLKPDGHLLLIDFGSAAPLLPPSPDGTQLLPKEYCLVPCGTCDYISPEILKAHEEALVALEMSDEESEMDKSYNGRPRGKQKSSQRAEANGLGYGRETDWWSLGAMIYEMAFGVAPFFANDIRQTYVKIMGHETSLTFDHKVLVPTRLVALMKGLLTHYMNRLGRYSVDEIIRQPFFEKVNWSTLHSQPAPPNLLLPQFSYTVPLTATQNAAAEDNTSNSSNSSKPFAFSALFQSSFTSKPGTSPALSFLHATPAFGRTSLSRASGSAKAIASFIGFSWGPPKDAFEDETRVVPAQTVEKSAVFHSPPLLGDNLQVGHALVTPMRPPKQLPNTLSTIRVARATSSVRRSAQPRPVSDREAMKQLVDCIGMSARKRVLESGKKPKILLPNLEGPVFSRPRSGSYSLSGTLRKKEIRFGDDTTHRYSVSTNRSSKGAQYITYEGTSDSSSDAEQPPSPSPSPRPGSAMSMISMGRRSVTPTPTTTGSFPLVRANSEPPSTGTGTWTTSRTGTISTLLTPTYPMDSTERTPRPIRSRTDLEVEEDDDPTPRNVNGRVANFIAAPPARVGESTRRMPREKRTRPPVVEEKCSGKPSPSNMFDEMERRYQRLMSDISQVKDRLDRLAVRLGVNDRT